MSGCHPIEIEEITSQEEQNVDFHERISVLEFDIKKQQQRIDSVLDGINGICELWQIVNELRGKVSTLEFQVKRLEESSGISYDSRINTLEEKISHIPIVRGKEGICYDLENIFNQIDKVESEIKRRSFNTSSILNAQNEWCKKIEKTVSELVDKIADIGNYYYKEKKQPHKCPVCEGRRNIIGEMPNGTYFEFPCKSCEGKGIVFA